MEMRCYRKILRISYKDHVTNEVVRAKIQQAIGQHEDLLTILKRRKLQWYGHVSVHQVWPKPSCKPQQKGEEDKADRGRGGKTTSGNGQKLETVTTVKYLGSLITDEILSRIAQITATLTRLKPVWNDNSIFLSSKIRLMHSLVTSIFLYACESWTLTAELQRRIQTMK